MKAIVPFGGRRAWAALLLLLFTGVSLRAGVEIKDIVLAPGTPAIVRPGDAATSDRLELAFAYESDTSFRAYCVPMSAGERVLYSHAGSPEYVAGSGSGNSWCKTNLEPGGVVDELFLYAVNVDQSRFLWWLRIPVHYVVGRHRVEVTAIDTLSPALLLDNDPVTVTLAYETDDPDGIYLWAYPRRGEFYPPGTGYQASPLHFGSGSTSRFFMVDDPGFQTPADAVRVTVQSKEATEVDRLDFPVDFRWGSVRFRDLSLSSWDYTDATYNFVVPYATTEALGIRPQSRPVVSAPVEIGGVSYSHGGYTTLHGTGTWSNYINLDDGLDRAVRGIHFSVRLGDNSAEIDTVQFPLPQPYHPDSPVYFTDTKVQPAVSGHLRTVPNQPAARACGILPPGQRIEGHFAAWNVSGLDCRVFVRPSIDGSVATGYAADGSRSIPSGGSWVHASGGFHFESAPAQPLTEVSFRLHPVTSSAPLWRIYQPVDLTILDPQIPGGARISRLGATWRIEWRCAPGFHVRVEHGTDLVGWTPVSGWLLSYGLPMHFDHSPGGSIPRMFYRLDVRHPGATPAP